MAFKKEDPTVAVQGEVGSGVFAVEAFDRPELTLPTAAIQERFVTRRTRLRPDLARVVAELIYGRAA